MSGTPVVLAQSLRLRHDHRSASTEATKDALQGLDDSTQIRTVLPRSACIAVTPHGTSPNIPSTSVTYDDFPDSMFNVRVTLPTSARCAPP